MDFTVFIGKNLAIAVQSACMTDRWRRRTMRHTCKSGKELKIEPLGAAERERQRGLFEDNRQVIPEITMYKAL